MSKSSAYATNGDSNQPHKMLSDPEARVWVQHDLRTLSDGGALHVDLTEDGTAYKLRAEKQNWNFHWRNRIADAERYEAFCRCLKLYPRGAVIWHFGSVHPLESCCGMPAAGRWPFFRLEQRAAEGDEKLARGFGFFDELRCVGVMFATSSHDVEYIKVSDIRSTQA